MLDTRELTPYEALHFALAAYRDAQDAGDKEAAASAGAFAARLWRNLDDGAELLPGERPIGKRELKRELVLTVARGGER